MRRELECGHVVTGDTIYVCAVNHGEGEPQCIRCPECKDWRRPK